MAPLIWAGLSVAGFLISWYVFDTQINEMDNIYNQFSELLDLIILGEPLTYEEFMEYFGVMIFIGFTILFIGLWIAFPKQKKGGRM